MVEQLALSFESSPLSNANRIQLGRLLEPTENHEDTGGITPYISEPATRAPDIPVVPRVNICCLLGSNTHNGDPLFWNPVRDALPNLHAVVVGAPGSGKSNLLTRILLHVSQLGTRVLCIDFNGDFSELHEVLHCRRVVVERLSVNPFHWNTEQYHYASHVANTFVRAVSEPFGLTKEQGAILGKHAFDYLTSGKRDFRSFYESLADSATTKPLWYLLYRLISDDVFAGTERLPSIADESLIFDFEDSANWNPGNDPVLSSLVNLILLQFCTLSRPRVRNNLRSLLLIDEAHRVASAKALSTLAREGRKYGISLILGSQCGNDIAEDVLDQIKARFVFSIATDDAKRFVREVVSTASVDSLAAAVSAQNNFMCTYLHGRDAVGFRAFPAICGTAMEGKPPCWTACPSQRAA
jgi:hypothetical protein